MAAMRGHFDGAAFYVALDEVRKAKDLTWRKVAELTRVSASTLTRMGQGKYPDADSLAMLSAWAGINPAEYVSDEGLRAAGLDVLPRIMALLRADVNLTPDAVDALQELYTVAYRRFAKQA